MTEKIAEEPFTKEVMQANFSAILYLLTEQQAMIGRLFRALLDSESINSQQLADITDLTSSEGGLIPTYTQVYNRFAIYYLRTKQVLDQGGGVGCPVDEDVKRRNDTGDNGKGKKDE